MMMPGRKYSAGSRYRYGFNGKENDSEVKGEGNEQDYGMRVYDPRLGRFLSVDPVTRTYPWYTPYQFAGNMPIVAIDLDGAEPKDGTIVTGGWGGQLTVRRASDQEIKEYQKGMGTAGAIGAAVATDIFVTKGWLTRTLLLSQGLSTLYHQPAKTPEQAKERGKETLEFLKDATVLTIMGKFLRSALTGEALVLSKGERLKIFTGKLNAAAPAKNQAEAIKLINNTLDEVEDAFSGVKKAKGVPAADDGRMYGILDEKYVKTLDDGTKIANTKGHRIVLRKDGSFDIQTKDGSKTILTKPGAPKK